MGITHTPASGCIPKQVWIFCQSYKVFNMPIISVIIPAFNAEKTIKETIESVLSQTFTDFELIVINDGSTDSTLSILDAIEDDRLKVFTYENRGVSISRNCGIEVATGDFIAFLDADDLWTAEKLELQLQALSTNPQAGLAYSWVDRVDQSGQFLRPGGHSTAQGYVYEKLLLRDFIEGCSSPLIRKSALLTVGNFDTLLTHAEDWDLWLRLAERYQFVVVPRTQVFYRDQIGSASYNVWKMEEGSLTIINHVFARVPDSLQPLKKQVISNRYKYLAIKSLEGKLNRQMGFAALRFLFWAVLYDLSWLAKRQLIMVILSKAIASVIFSDGANVLLMSIKTRVRKQQST